MNMEHVKKYIAPIIVTVIVVLYYVVFAAVCITIDDIPVFAAILGGIVPLLLAGVCVYVLVERINEIRSGEEDDLSKY